MYTSKYTAKEIDSMLIEMRALVAFCEITDCKIARNGAKQRLRELSEIPKANKNGCDILTGHLYV